MRILLGWAWTYLIVAEVFGTMSGITLFITLQGRYLHYENVYAAIAMIGIIGLTTDMILAGLAGVLFPWKRRRTTSRRRPKADPGAIPAAPVAPLEENAGNPLRSEA
jgi:hypothetical protein